MMISEKHKIVFLAIPKTGTRTIYNYFEKNLEGVLIQDHALKVPKQLEDWFCFTVVRNPYDRACSIHWAVNKRDGPSHGFDELFTKYNMDNTLENYLKIVREAYKKPVYGVWERHYPHDVESKVLFKRTFHSIKQIEYLKYNKLKITILKNENLNESFKQLPFGGKLQNINSTKDIRSDWEKIMTKKEIDLVNEIYEEDFKMFEYKML